MVVEEGVSDRAAEMVRLNRLLRSLDNLAITGMAVFRDNAVNSPSSPFLSVRRQGRYDGSVYDQQDHQ